MERNTNAFERFRRTNTTYNKCLVKSTSYFISNHESKAMITINRTAEELLSVLVVNDKDGADNFTLFTYKDDDVVVGDYFTWKEENHFFIYEKCHVIKEVDYNKFKTLECNVLVNGNIWACFKGNQTSFKDNTLQNSILLSGLKPVLIAPIQDIFVLNGYIKFNDKTWHIVDADIDTLHGIGYYYLERSLNSRDLEQDTDELYEENILDNANTYYVGQTIEVRTSKGFIKSNLDIDIIKRSENSVVFKTKQTGSLKITVINESKEVVYNYTVKE